MTDPDREWWDQGEGVDVLDVSQFNGDGRSRGEGWFGVVLRTGDGYGAWPPEVNE